MSRLTLVLVSVLGGASLGASWATQAGDPSPLPAPNVSFAPGYEASFERAYGAKEIPALRSLITDSVLQSLKSAGVRCKLGLDVTLERAAPTHPTMKQQLDSPSLDPIRTVYRDGGASLTGHVLDASGRALTTVKFQRFNDLLPPLTVARDPWADARMTFDMFANRLVEGCIKQTAAAGG